MACIYACLCVNACMKASVYIYARLCAGKSTKSIEFVGTVGETGKIHYVLLTDILGQG